jgi:hypothetical protein
MGEGTLFLGPWREGKKIFRGIVLRVSKEKKKCPVIGSLSP